MAVSSLELITNLYMVKVTFAVLHTVSQIKYLILSLALHFLQQGG